MIRKLFDSNNNTGWLIVGIVLFVVGLFVSFFMPVIFAMTRFQIVTNLGFSPSAMSFKYMLLAFTLLALGFYLIYRFDQKKYRILGGALGFGLGILMMIFAYNSYTYVDENYIMIGKGYSEKKYEWSEMKKLEYYQTDQNIWYEITADNGDKFEVVIGGLIDTGSQNHIRRTLEEYGVKMIDLSE